MKRALVIVSKTLNKKTLKYYSQILSEESIYFVSPCEDIYLKNFKNVNFRKDDFFLKREDYPIIEQTSRPNWYYQQFLKYSIVLNLDYDFVHIVDGDSFVKKEILFSDKIYYSNKTIEDNYDKFIVNLNRKESFSKRNYITNQMCFNRNYLISLIYELNFTEENWINRFSDSLISYKNNWFSEYQLYANYLLQNHNFKEKPIKVFRRFDLINDDYDKGFSKYDVLASEPQHKTGILRRVRALLYYTLALNFG
jgi:hypothetical protein